MTSAMIPVSSSAAWMRTGRVAATSPACSRKRKPYTAIPANSPKMPRPRPQPLTNCRASSLNTKKPTSRPNSGSTMPNGSASMNWRMSSHSCQAMEPKMIAMNSAPASMPMRAARLTVVSGTSRKGLASVLGLASGRVQAASTLISRKAPAIPKPAKKSQMRVPRRVLNTPR